MSVKHVPAPIFYKRFSEGDATCPTTAPQAGTRAAAGDVEATPWRSTRPTFAVLAPSSPKLAKRKREPTEAGMDCDDARERHRKAKKEERDEQRAELSSTRADLDVARKRWLYANRALFEPLLPSSQKGFFAQLNKEMAPHTTPPLPMHDFVVQPELIVGGEMKEYQLAGLSFLAHMYHNGINALLGDEMGLGKTLQTLSLFAHIKETPGPALTHLVVCPLSVLSSWETECKRWVPSMRAVRFHGSPEERERLKGTMRATDSPVDIVFTTYETLSSSDNGWFKTRRWACVVLDEGHRIKNADSDAAARAAGLGGLWRVILTGTPIQNNLTELWGLLHWLYPQIFTQTTRTLFASSFDLANGTYALPVLNAVRELLATIQLRRTKATLTDSGALGGVPPREEWTVFIPLTEAQRFWTYRMLTRLEKVDLEAIFPRTKDEDDGKMDAGRREVLKHLETHAKGDTTTKQWQKFSMLLMQLRRICDHPYMIDDAEPEEYQIGEHIVASSSKLMAIDKILADVLPKGERVLIFSQWTDMLDLLEDFMVLRGITYVRLDGSVSRARRAMVIRMFQRDDSQYKVFLISTKAGGLGINLTKASTCILCDSDWNPQNDLQAIARSHRIGQTKVVKVFRLICRASVEDQMLDRIRRKLFLSAKIIGDEAGPNGGPNVGMGGSELMSILRRGSSALTSSDDEMNLEKFRTASLAEILEVSRARNDVHDARVKHELKMEVDETNLLRSAEAEEKQLLSGVARVQSYLFEGTLLERSKAPKVNTQSATPQKRGRVDRTVTVGGMSFILDDSTLETINSKGNATATPKKVKKERFEWEDYCMSCRDGGEVAICNHCPRVFHAGCHPTHTAQEVNAAPLINCSQHSCRDCARSTTAAGGLLLRCQTCPYAFCSDCVPWDDIKMVGDTIPEFVLRKFGKIGSAYFIRCADCCEQGRADPAWAKAWEAEIAEAQRLVDLL
ncbi:P-loop containing nucleoside triphosphate hydrolase protein [Mycena rosella]|uniref:P-loop containing nucleoside triphosphate hydrolase protein n=1 Tax=Mycena rosella TaxID=1033263 RepID=A0AAD7G3Y5_MYCRO|nr:P-loop containing nucleoside triphosphate hydrolase protein [Mycena rosella]